MYRSTFQVPQMDCPSEENLIRVKLAELSVVKALEFDLPARRLVVYHEGHARPVEAAIATLQLGGQRTDTHPVDKIPDATAESDQRQLLWSILIINFTFFLVEAAAGWWSGSMGLGADSLDMLADSFVYSISLLAVGGNVLRKKRIARLAGYFQIALAVLGFVVVLYRFIGDGAIPHVWTMVVVSLLALVANALCLYLLRRSRDQSEAHLQASMIFTSNDIIINLGVIVAAVLVYVTSSALPDLLVGTVVFALVLRGAFRILRLGR